MQQKPTCIGVLACDAADDRFAAQWMASLRSQRPSLRFVGVGGPMMQAQGTESYVAMERLSTHPRERVTSGRRGLRRMRQSLIQRLRDADPALFVAFGTPGFSLEIAGHLRRAGVRTAQYAGPAVWTWREWRVKRIGVCLSRALTRFPFETALYERAGIPASFVGHPLADSLPIEADKAAARTQLRLPHGKLIVALMPGDQTHGLRAIAETFVKAAHRFCGEFKDVHFLIPAITRRYRELFESAVRLHADGDLPLTVLFGHGHEALAAADLALVADETAALEAVLLKTPMISMDRAPNAVQWWSRWLRYGPTVSLPNRLAGEPIVPEFLPKQATPWALAAALIALMRDADARRRQIERFHDIHRELRQDSALRACDAVAGMLNDASG